MEYHSKKLRFQISKENEMIEKSGKPIGIKKLYYNVQIW